MGAPSKPEFLVVLRPPRPTAQKLRQLTVTVSAGPAGHVCKAAGAVGLRSAVPAPGATVPPVTGAHHLVSGEAGRGVLSPMNRRGRRVQAIPLRGGHRRAFWTLSALPESEGLVIFSLPSGSSAPGPALIPPFQGLPGCSGLRGNLPSSSPRPFCPPVPRGPHPPHKARLCGATLCRNCIPYSGSPEHSTGSSPTDQGEPQVG